MGTMRSTRKKRNGRDASLRTKVAGKSVAAAPSDKTASNTCQWFPNQALQGPAVSWVKAAQATQWYECG